MKNICFLCRTLTSSQSLCLSWRRARYWSSYFKTLICNFENLLKLFTTPLPLLIVDFFICVIIAIIDVIIINRPEFWSVDPYARIYPISFGFKLPMTMLGSQVITINHHNHADKHCYIYVMLHIKNAISWFFGNISKTKRALRDLLVAKRSYFRKTIWFVG